MRLWLHFKLRPRHQPIGLHGVVDACGTCSGFSSYEIRIGAVAHRPPSSRWRVQARPLGRFRPDSGRCPGCGAYERSWCFDSCPLTDLGDWR